MCTAPAIPTKSEESKTMEAPAPELTQAIIGELRANPARPIELLERLGGRFSYFDIKEAVLRLLRDGDLELTSDRRLKVPPA
jgi:hypothetical protein